MNPQFLHPLPTYYLVTQTLIHPCSPTLGLSLCLSSFLHFSSFVVFCSPLELRCRGRQWRWWNPSELINFEASFSRSVLLSWTNGFYPWKSSDEECCRPGFKSSDTIWFFLSFFLSLLPYLLTRTGNLCACGLLKQIFPVQCGSNAIDISLRECWYFVTAGSE